MAKRMTEMSRYPQTMVLKSTGAFAAAALLVAAIWALPAGAQGDATYVTPQTRITFGPSSKTRKHEVVFRFTDATGQPGTKFACKLGSRPWKGCESPHWLKKLSLGRHVFAVKAVNRAGEWDKDPARRSFKVVR